MNNEEKTRKKEEQSFSLPVYDQSGKEIKRVSLKKEIFQASPNLALLHQAMLMYQANARQGTSATKERGDVRGGGKKPWRQKGTGRARHGTIRSPLWRHGGIIFGPHPRDYSYALPKSMRQSAFRHAFSAKVRDAEIILLEGLKLEAAKTKKLMGILKLLKAEGRVLLVLGKKDPEITQAGRNLADLKVCDSDNFSILDFLGSNRIILANGAFEKLQKKLFCYAKSNGNVGFASQEYSPQK
jgi:large subunit ribosomal protein L4